MAKQYQFVQCKMQKQLAAHYPMAGNIKCIVCRNVQPIVNTETFDPNIGPADLPDEGSVEVEKGYGNGNVGKSLRRVISKLMDY